MRTDTMPDDALTDTAAAWFARMRGPDAAADRPAFEAWLMASPAHLEAYNWIAEVFSLGRLVGMESDAIPKAIPARGRQLQAALAVALLLAISVAGWSFLRHRPDRIAPIATRLSAASGRDLADTVIGQIRTIGLPDGSRMTLDTDSAVAIVYRGDVRRLELTRGRARFDVAHEARPFVVVAGNGTITAHGTVFDVGMISGGAVMVRLLRGRIDVALSTGAAGKAATRWLTPGQQVAFRTSILPSARVAVTPDDRWPQGMLDCDGMALTEVVAHANRYARPQLVLADPSLGALKVSGAFRIDRPQLLAQRLATVFGLHADAQGTRIVIDRGPGPETKSKTPP